MRARSRQRVLEYIARHPRATASQIAGGLGMSAPAVRHHISILRADGRVRADSSGVGPRRGRPRLAFRIPDQMKGNNLEVLADLLLAAWSGTAPQRRGRRRLPDVLGDHLITRLQGAEIKPSATRRLDGLVQKLNDLAYEPRWEAGAEGPSVIFARCPYGTLAQRHPELCQMDARMVAQTLGASARQIAKVDPDAPGPTQCVFSLRYTQK